MTRKKHRSRLHVVARLKIRYESKARNIKSQAQQRSTTTATSAPISMRPGRMGGTSNVGNIYIGSSERKGRPRDAPNVGRFIPSWRENRVVKEANS